MTEEDDSLEGSRMTLGEHLDELRRRLIRSAIALTVVLVGTWSFRTQIAAIVLQPFEFTVERLNDDLVEIYTAELAADPSIPRTRYFVTDDPDDLRLNDPVPNKLRGDTAQTGFFFYLKVCAYFSAFLAGPYILWEIWQFIAAGLYRRERKAIYHYFPFSAGLFLGGVVFGYLVLVPYGMYFLAAMTLGQIDYYAEAGAYFTFLFGMTLALGAVFQLPIVMLGLSRLGLVEPRTYSRYRGHFVITALVIAAILTPPDPITQMMMAVPMIALYELGALLARLTAAPASEPSPAT